MTEYIDKSAVIAEIERRLEALANTSAGDNREFAAIIGAQQYELIKLAQYINTLEVKEVNYERELSKYVSNGIHRFFPNEEKDYCTIDSIIWQDYVIETAEYFFELGLKAQKGK